MKTIKKGIKILLSSILIFIVIISLYTLISMGLFKRSYVNFFGYTYFVIASGSMSPTIEVNDIIIVDIGANYKENDIITYKSGDSFITHRLVKIGDKNIITKGDANNTEDENVLKKDVVGKVCTIISASLIFKSLAIVIISFILISVINFEEIFKKYIKREKETAKSPLEVTSVIPIVKEDNEFVDEILSKTTTYGVAKIQVAGEILEIKKAIKDDGKPDPKGADKVVIKELFDILKAGKRKSKITTEGAIKLQYMYKLCKTIEINPKKVESVVDNISFEELFDYSFEEIGFSKSIKNRIYSMPIYVYILIMIYSIQYANEDFFDAMYKSLKYRIKVDQNNEFISNNYKIDKCITYIEKIVSKCDHPEKFELEKIKKLVILDKNE